MRCINCGIATGRLRRHVVSSLDMPFQRMLGQWLTIQLPEDGLMCHPCFLLLTSEGANHRILGHTMVCFGCGRSVRDIRHHIIESEAPLLLQFSFTARLQGITKNYVCHPCWMKANRQHQDSSREETGEPADNIQNENAVSPPPEPPILPPPAILHYFIDGTEDSINLPGGSQLDKDKVAEKEVLQTSKDAPMEVIECAYSSSTESALSDTDNLPLKTFKEQMSLKNDDVPKSSSEEAEVESTAAVQYRELNRTEEMELDDEVQSRANKPVRVRKQKRLVKKNTQTTAEAQRTQETIEQYKVYTIIANVYNYLSREYDLLKSQLGKRYDLSSLANILQRTAAATGVTQRTVNAALVTSKLKTIRSDHSYILDSTRTNTARTKSKKAGSSANVRRKGRTQHFKRLTSKHQDDESDGEERRLPKRRPSRNSIKSKPTNEEQLPSDTDDVFGSKTQTKDRIPSYKRRTNNEQDHDSEGDGVRPPKRRSDRYSVRNTPNNEEQVPFPSPIQLGVPEAMEIEFKAEPADECQQTLENDPLGPVSQFPILCRTPEATETEFKAEPADDECLQKTEADPLETESSPAALEEPSDPSDASEIEMKIERVDEEYAELCTDYSICDPALLDIKPEPPSE